jgi:hypothetical protein
MAGTASSAQSNSGIKRNAMVGALLL